jgi:murein DD-endopeptidase MepM/ murein hydrolase activator NlpD
LSPPANRTSSRSNWVAEGGTPITVAQGESIDSISRRYGVPAATIMRANNISAPGSIRPGQSLIIPRYYALAEAARVAPVSRAGQTTTGLAPKPAAASDEQAHVVAPGETLSSIARTYHRSRIAIAKANNLEPDGKLRVGQRVVVPGTKHALLRVAAAGQPAPTTALSADATAAPKLAMPQGPAGAAGAAHPTSPPSEGDAEITSASTPSQGAGANPNFRWPVHGKIIAAFGSKPSGQQNDGINLAVPEGTPIKAAEDGVVAYAGNELKGYGNLVLVRHPNGFVTAYANASELMVKRGDQVKRGQVIAHSGQTGTVSAPQLHFEIRKGATPVDPTQYLTGT